MTNDLYTPYTGLTDERYTWAVELKQGVWNEPYVLQQYRINRDSNLWRSTREVEKLCEYILHLEGAKPMSELYQVNCDQCNNNISTVKYRLLLVQEMPNQDAQGNSEIDRRMNYCNLACLKAWSNSDRPQQ